MSTAGGGSPAATTTAGAKRRCPTGECQPAWVWIKAHRLHELIANETSRQRGIHKRRGAVEREFGGVKN